MTNDNTRTAAVASLFLGMVTAGSGCIPGEYQREDQMPTGAGEGPPVSSYAIPADPSTENAAKGAMHVISFGSERLPVPAGLPQMYVHLRLAADNVSDDVTWTVDPNEQLLIHGGQSSKPTFSEGSEGQPLLKVEKGKRAYLDVYYPLPPEGDAARVTLSWRLHRGEEVAARTTEFSRVDGKDTQYVYYQPAPGHYVYSGLGLDTWWWSDYYFWHHGGMWWPCRRDYIHARYPGYWGGPVAGGGSYSRTPTSDGPSTSPRRTSTWRGGASPTPASTSTKSSWRGTPSFYEGNDSSSRSSGSSSSGSSSGGGSSSGSSGGSNSGSSGSSGGSNSGGGSSGKSGWRGGGR